jgi:uncharacterized glyoxalase superfamily protein PhnB
MLLRSKDSTDHNEHTMEHPRAEGKMMDMAFRIGATTLLASDERRLGRPEFRRPWLSFTAPDPPEVERLLVGPRWAVRMRLTETVCSPRLGIVVDRLGVWWLVDAAHWWPVPAGADVPRQYARNRTNH